MIQVRDVKEISDLIAHYKAVRHRMLTQARVYEQTPRLRHARKIYDAPIGPNRPRLIDRPRDILNIGSVDAEGVPIVRPMTAREVIDHILARYPDVSRVDLMSQRRTSRVVTARHEAMWLLRRHTTMSLPQIGRLMGGRDHTTVMHAVRRFQAMLDRGDVTL